MAASPCERQRVESLRTSRVGSRLPHSYLRRPAGNAARSCLILPDYSARLSVLDFDSFPEKAEDQAALIRFRIRRSVPFDIDSAALSYWRQNSPGGKSHEVVVAVTPA